MRLALALFLLSAAASADEAVEALWKEKNCVKCHGADRQGQTEMGRKLKVPNFTRPRWQQRNDDDEKLRKVIREGVKEKGKVLMPAFKSKLTPDQIDQLVQHVRAFDPSKPDESAGGEPAKAEPETR